MTAIAILQPKDRSYSLLSKKLTDTVVSQFIYINCILQKKMTLQKLIPLLGLVLFPTAASAQYPIIFNHIKDTNLSQGRCVDNAGATMKRAGFTERFEFLRTGAFAVKGRYSAIIRCTADKNIVFFAVAGPDNKTAENLVVRLRNSF